MNENYQVLSDYALRLLSFRARSVSELQKKLSLFAAKKHIKETYIEKIITSLQKQKLLDDYTFASWWIEQRNTFRPKGKRALEIELMQKGIGREVIREVVEKSFTEKREYELARDLVKKKNIPQEKRMNFLLRRGFSYDTIRAVDSLSEKEYNRK